MLSQTLKMTIIEASQGTMKLGQPRGCMDTYSYLLLISLQLLITLIIVVFFSLLTLLSLKIICMTCIGGGCHAFGGG